MPLSKNSHFRDLVKTVNNLFNPSEKSLESISDLNSDVTGPPLGLLARPGTIYHNFKQFCENVFIMLLSVHNLFE